MKAGILFGGFGGVEIGMLQAGITPVWSIEKSLGISTVAGWNFEHKVIWADILAVDPHTLESVDILHASPPCPAFSLANATGRGETTEDIALAQKTAQFVKILKPRIFTLENVWLYRKSESWQIIRDSLYEAGYWLDVAHVNSADYGVPQTRKRMIVRAILGGFVPYLPQVEQWRGWYGAVEDLIPDLPNSQFANWQLARLPDELKTFLLMTSNTNTYDFDCHPGKGVLGIEQPANTVTTGQLPRAFLVNSQNTKRPLTIRDKGRTAFVITASALEKNSPPKAFIVANGCYEDLVIRVINEPVFTITANSNQTGIKSFIIPMRAWLSHGRIVSMTVRALARFQSFPDWYRLPDSNRLACYGIGNAVPPLMYQKIIGGSIEVIGGASC